LPSAVDRDVIDWLVAAFTISTGIVLALAAAFAFLLQRARFLRDIEPDLRITDASKIIVLPGRDISDSDSVRLRIELEVQNASKNTAERLSSTQDATIGIQSSTSPLTVVHLPYFNKSIEVQERLLPGRSLPISVYIELSASRLEIESQWLEMETPLQDRIFRATVTIRYSSPKELALIFVKPLRLKEDYERTFFVEWQWEAIDADLTLQLLYKAPIKVLGTSRE